MTVRFPFEQAVIDGQPMPDGLCLLDQHAFVLLQRIYTNFRSGLYSKEQAGAEKSKLYRQWKKETDAATFADKLTRHHVLVTKKTERLKAEIRKSAEPETIAGLALELVDVLDGLVFDEGEGDDKA